MAKVKITETVLRDAHQSLIATRMTMDEMLPILIGGGMAPRTVIGILVYKTSAGIIMGFLIDLILRIGGGEKRKINIDEICERGGCNCEGGGIFKCVGKACIGKHLDVV